MPDAAAVFLVDDDPSVQKALTRLIASKGYKVECFSSANEFLNRSHFDGSACLILDIQMPGLDGLQLQQELLLAGYSIPIIFITAHGTIPMSVQAMKGGAVDFLMKPFSGKQLLSAIEKAIQRNAKKQNELSEVQVIKNRVSSLSP